MEFSIFLILAIGGGFIYLIFYGQNKLKKEISVIQSENKFLLEDYIKKRSEIEIPEKCRTIFSNSSKKIGEKTLIKGVHYVWNTDDFIYFFPTKWNIDYYYEVKISARKTPHPEIYNDCFKLVGNWPQPIELFSIKIKDIEVYCSAGEKYYENKISGSGGGGGGSSIGNAVVGGIIAGPTGAIIASRNKIDPIKIESELIEHDERCCILTFSQDSVRYSLSFDDIEVFRELLPEKENIILNKIRENNLIKNHTSQGTDIIQKIRNLGTLKDEGLLTLQEFEEKKKELLLKV